MQRIWKMRHAVLLAALFLCVVTATPAEEPPCTSDPWLASVYAEYNAQYFGDSLPKDTLTCWSEEGSIESVVFYALTLHVRPVQVYFSPKIKHLEAVLRMTMLHEMVHVKLGRSSAEHGKAFQKEMLRLAKRGAFQSLW